MKQSQAASESDKRPKPKHLPTAKKSFYLISGLFLLALIQNYRTFLFQLHDQLAWQSQLESELDSEFTIPKSNSIPVSVSPQTKGPTNSTTIAMPILPRSNKTNSTAAVPQRKRIPPRKKESTCAILLFGLPRAFKNFVLPSLEKNVIGPNARYGCDYFVHYYEQDREASSRSGNGGVIRHDDIFLLRDAVTKFHRQAHKKKSKKTTTIPEVGFVSDTNETFWRQRGSAIEHYRTAKNQDGRYAFFPHAEPTYEYPGTLDNIVKQWHSINAVWDEMEKASANSTDINSKPHQYRRVALMRNDVIFLTPIDIYKVPEAETASKNSRKDDFSTNAAAVIPNFAKYPVNDRLIYGPHSAVKIWASQRFERIEDYAKDPLAIPGMVMHSETFLNASILQAIKETNLVVDNDNNSNHRKDNSDQHVLQQQQQQQQRRHVKVVEDKWLCFLRVRADGAIWIEDCDAKKSGGGGGYPGGMATYTKLLHEVLPSIPWKRCRKRRLRDPVRRIQQLVCPKIPDTSPG